MQNNFGFTTDLPNTDFNNNNNVNNIVFMDMPRQDPKEGRVSVKDVRRSAACLLCRNRKRKCDGQDPCSYCVSKNWACTYTQQKKRGPQKKTIIPTSGSPSGGDQQSNQLQVVSPITHDCELSEKMEAMSLGNIYLKYVNAMVPMTTSDKMMNPANSAHKVQSYAALAYTARICGDLNKASKYISQGRMLAGDIYDSPDPDAISGMLMMSNYFQLTLNMSQCAHYSRMANSLRHMLPSGTSLDYRVKMVAEVTGILTDEVSSNKKKAKLLRDLAKSVLNVPEEEKKEYLTLISAFLKLSSYVVGFLDYSPMVPMTLIGVNSCQEFYTLFDKIHLDDKVRMLVLEEVNRVSVTCALLQTGDAFDIHLKTIQGVFTPMYMAIVEWRSGRPQEALSFCITVLQALNSFEKNDAIGFACGVLDFPHLALMAGLCKFLLDIGQNNVAAQLNEKIMVLCKMLTPEFDFVMKFANEFMTLIPAIDQPPTITLLEEEDEDEDIPIQQPSPTTNLHTSNTNNVFNHPPNSPLHTNSNQFLNNSSPNTQFLNNSSPNTQFLNIPSPNTQFLNNSTPNNQFLNNAPPNNQFLNNSTPNFTYSHPSPPLPGYTFSPPPPFTNNIPSPSFTNNSPLPSFSNNSPSPSFTNNSPPFQSTPSPVPSPNYTAPSPPLYTPSPTSSTTPVYTPTPTPIPAPATSPYNPSNLSNLNNMNNMNNNNNNNNNLNNMNHEANEHGFTITHYTTTQNSFYYQSALGATPLIIDFPTATPQDTTNNSNVNFTDNMPHIQNTAHTFNPHIHNTNNNNVTNNNIYNNNYYHTVTLVDEIHNLPGSNENINNRTSTNEIDDIWTFS